MDKAIIVGTFEFIGFHLCLSLLEQGTEVIGIHLLTEDDDVYLEEKRLEIGRNSNFSEKDETYFASSEEWPSDAVIFIDYYSYYMNRQEHKLEKALGTPQFLNTKSRFVFLLPIQLYEEKSDYNVFLFQKRDQERDSHMFFLPTIYGPWQPSYYTFHQALLDHALPIIVGEREWVEDALYIDDAVRTIRLHSKDTENNMFLLRSKIKNHWRKVAKKLLIDPPVDQDNGNIKVNKDIVVLNVEGKDIDDGIDTQKRHLARLT